MVEFPEEIQALRSHFPGREEQAQSAVFALNPQAYFLLRDDAFQRHPLAPLTGEEAKQFAQRVEEQLDECQAALPADVLKYAPSLLFFLRWPLTYQLYLQRAFEHALLAPGCQDVEVLGLDFTPREERDLALTPGHNLHHDSLREWAGKKGLRFTSLKVYRPLRKCPGRACTRLWAGLNALLSALALRLLRPQKVLFITSKKSNLPRIAQTARGPDEIMVFLRNANPLARASWKEWAAATYFNALAVLRAALRRDLVLDLTYLGPGPGAPVLPETCLAAYPVLRKISASLSTYVGHLKAVESEFGNFLAASRPGTKTFMSIDNVGDNALLGGLAREFSQRSLLITHGSHALAPDQATRRQLFRHAQTLFLGDQTHVAIQSRPAQKFFEEHGHASRPVLTGPLSWGSDRPSGQGIRERFGLAPDDILAVHAGTAKYWPGMRFYMYEDLFGYVRSIADAIQAVEQCQRAFLIVKFRPNPMLGVQALKALLPAGGRYAISVEERLCDVIQASDLLISYSSTTMEEALEYRRPVVQYSIGTDFCFLPALKMAKNAPFRRSAVYWTDDKQELSGLVAKIAEEFRRRPMTDEDLSEYSIPGQERRGPRDFFL